MPTAAFPIDEQISQAIEAQLRTCRRPAFRFSIRDVYRPKRREDRAETITRPLHL